MTTVPYSFKDVRRLEAATSLETIATMVAMAAENLRRGYVLLPDQNAAMKEVEGYTQGLRVIAHNIRNEIGKP